MSLNGTSIFGSERVRAAARLIAFLGLLAVILVFAGAGLARWVPEDTSFAGQVVISHALLVVATLAASGAMLRTDGQPLTAQGLPLDARVAPGLLRGAAVGAVLVASIVAVQMALGWLRPGSDAGTAADALATLAGLTGLFAVGAVAEELLFRGYGFQRLVIAIGAVPAVVLDAILFASVHAGNPAIAPLAFVNVGLAGALLAVVYLRTRSLWVVIGLHWAWNWTMGALFDLPVSGLRFDVPGYDLLQSGPLRLTGGAFGPEGGLLSTAGLAVALVWASRTRRLGGPEPGGPERGDHRDDDG